MPEANEPYIFKCRLLDRALHFDFLRLRCGTEARFHQAVSKLQVDRTAERPRTFMAMSEWDAVVLLPSRELYPRVLNTFYENPEVDATIAGTSGYFGYLWNHNINNGLDDKLNEFQRSGLAFVISLRFEDWVRRELGLGAEILFCNFLESELRHKNGLSAVVAHTLGWNDIVLVLHALTQQERLLEMQSRIRLLTLKDLLPPKDAARFGANADAPMFAASYTHLIGGYEAVISGHKGMGKLSRKVVDATLLIRVAPPLEWAVRQKIEDLSGGRLLAKNMPTEVGHYTFSTKITSLFRDNEGRDGMQLLSDIRGYIGEQMGQLLSSYAETTTVLRFREPSKPTRKLVTAEPDPGLKKAIGEVRSLIKTLPDLLKGRGVSPMAVHRFVSVMTTLFDHLSDPIRSSVVRHLTRFLGETSKVAGLDRQDMEDLCQICEYAMTQATDGIAQFQHDANALGLTGRGGYSRLIAAIENYVDDIFGALDLFDRNFLITFGQRVGHEGSVGRFHIDVPFNVLFVPSRWYILLHEAGHIAWGKKFGWMAESLAVFDEMEREIEQEPRVGKRKRRAVRPREKNLQARADFIRTRELIRELFPNLLVYRVACGGDLAEFDRVSLRHILSRSRPGRGTRELLVAVVLHCILKMTEAGNGGRAWLSMLLTNWKDKEINEAVREATTSLARALDLPPEEALSEHTRALIKNKKRLIVSDPLRDAARESVKSVLKVLGFIARQFTNEKHLGSYVFEELDDFIKTMIHHQKNSASWREQGFAKWMIGGEVLSIAPGAEVWARLLLESRTDIKSAENKAAFMVSQLAALLSIWHRAAVSPEGDDHGAKRVLHTRLIPLDLVEKKVFTVSTTSQSRRRGG